MAGFLSDIVSVQQIPWGARYLWDIAFPAAGGVSGAPSPFDKWFPALDVKEPLGKLTTYDFDAHVTKYSVPQGSEQLQIQITFADDESNTLATWLENWVNVVILNNGFYVSPVASCCKLLQVIKLNRQRQQVQTRSYWVFPTGEIVDERSSASETQTYSATFVVVGGALGADRFNP